MILPTELFVPEIPW